MAFLIRVACPIVINFITYITIVLVKYVRGNFFPTQYSQKDFFRYLCYIVDIFFFQLIATMVLIFLVNIVGSICISQSFT